MAVPPVQAKRLAAGAAISCTIDNDSVLKCWGDGAIGNGGGGSSAAVPVTGAGQNVLHVAAGGGHSCAVEGIGRVRCWGNNGSGQLGNNSYVYSATPVDSVGLASGMRDVATGDMHSCAVSNAGTVFCWGHNGQGQVGDNSTTSRLVPVTISGATNSRALALGQFHSCALSNSGGVQCWGDNSKGQLGDGTTLDRLTPIAVSGLASGVSAIAAGGNTTCALLTGGSVKCWGSNSSGQVGDGTINDRATPTTVLNLSSIAEISLGEAHACARSTAGAAFCWGENSSGQLGDTSTTDRLSPVAVSGLAANVVELATGYAHSCVRMKDQGMRCFGSRYGGRLGDGKRYGTAVTTPQAIAALAAPVDRLSGGSMFSNQFVSLYGHNCAVTADGAALCWGSNYAYQIGDGVGSASETWLYAPQPVAGASSGVDDIGGGLAHGCLLTRSGAVKCWGTNTYGQVGDNTTTTRAAPQNVVNAAAQITRLSVGAEHACVRTSAGAVRCWGRNQKGQLGDGSAIDRPVATNVSGLASGIIQVSAGGGHSCALSSAGGLKCWGDNTYGQLGDGTLTARVTPVNVNGLASGVAWVSAGETHTCALLVSGAVKCWGDNAHGQLGDGSVSSSPLALDVISLGAGSTTLIRAGGAHTCARSSAGALLCWGANDRGQLGDGSTAGKVLPTPVTGMQSGVGVIGTSARNTCATRGDLVFCTGQGSLGNGDGQDRLVPTQVATWRVAGDLIFRNGFQ